MVSDELEVGTDAEGVALSKLCFAEALRVSMDGAWKPLVVTAGAVGASISIEGDIGANVYL